MLGSSAGVNLEGVRSWEVQWEWPGQEGSSHSLKVLLLEVLSCSEGGERSSQCCRDPP